MPRPRAQVRRIPALHRTVLRPPALHRTALHPPALRLAALRLAAPAPLGAHRTPLEGHLAPSEGHRLRVPRRAVPGQDLVVAEAVLSAAVPPAAQAWAEHPSWALSVKVQKR